MFLKICVINSMLIFKNSVLRTNRKMIVKATRNGRRVVRLLKAIVGG